MEGASDRRVGGSFTDRLRVRSRPTRTECRLATSETAPREGDRGARDPVALGARGRKRRAPTRDHPSKRIGRRETPGPPASVGEGASLRSKGRGASLGEMLGAKQARVLVFESKWEAEVGRKHRARAPWTVARQDAGGRASPSHTARSADADRSRSPRKWGGPRGAVEPRAARREGKPQRCRVAPGIRAKRCTGITPERHRDGMMNDSVRRREASGVRG